MNADVHAVAFVDGTRWPMPCSASGFAGGLLHRCGAAHVLALALAC